MAPLTRLRAHPELRVFYGDNRPTAPSAAPSAALDHHPARRPEVQGTRKSPRSATSKLKECTICAEEKFISRSFKQPDNACSHIGDICKRCIWKMLIDQIDIKQFPDAGLPCPFECDGAIDSTSIKYIFSKHKFDKWEHKASMECVRSHISTMPCLNVGCGHYFYTENCSGNESGQRQKVVCPYCDYELCLSCSRPWHEEAACKNIIKDIKSQQILATHGTKSCPNCDLDIQKEEGCDHITCPRCRYNWCWVCFVEFTPTMRHAAFCPHLSQGNNVGEPDQLEEHLAPADMGFMGGERLPLPLWDPFGDVRAAIGDDLE